MLHALPCLDSTHLSIELLFFHLFNNSKIFLEYLKPSIVLGPEDTPENHAFALMGLALFWGQCDRDNKLYKNIYTRSAKCKEK